MISYPPEDHAIFFIFLFFHFLSDSINRMPQPRIVAWQPQHTHLTAGKTLPNKTIRLRNMVIRPTDNIAVKSAFFHNLHQSPRMTKGIKIDGRGRLRTEFFFKIALSDADLAYKRFAGRHIAVGLKIPSAHDMPISFFY